MRVEDDILKKWCLSITSHLPLLTVPINPNALEDFTARTQAAIHKATEEHMEHKKCLPAHNNTWWNDECAVATATLREASTQNAPQDEITALCKSYKDYM